MNFYSILVILNYASAFHFWGSFEIEVPTMGPKQQSHKKIRYTTFVSEEHAAEEAGNHL